jgi:hypothetical protein
MYSIYSSEFLLCCCLHNRGLKLHVARNFLVCKNVLMMCVRDYCQLINEFLKAIINFNKKQLLKNNKLFSIAHFLVAF